MTDAQRREARIESLTTTSFLLPAVIIILFLSLFPLIASLYISLSRLEFAGGGVQLNFVGLEQLRAARHRVSINRALSAYLELRTGASNRGRAR